MGICVLVVMVNLPQASHAQFDGGGGGIVVFDPSNFAKNSITAAQMLKQVANSTQEVALLLRNLIATGGAWEDTAQLLRLLNEVLATGEALHYQLPDLDQQMQQRFPGYIVPSLWVTSYQR
jgi:conjugal transfer/entry exclusion protein